MGSVRRLAVLAVSSLSLALLLGASEALAQVGCCVVIGNPDWCCFSAADRTAAQCTADSGGTAMFKAGTCEGPPNNPGGVCNGIGPEQQCSGHGVPAIESSQAGLLAVLLVGVAVCSAAGFALNRRRRT